MALSALLFLYRHVLDIELPYIDDIERAKRPERLPVVLTRTEVKQILAHLDGVHLLIAKLLYGTGRRLTEGLKLRVKDVDFEYRPITLAPKKEVGIFQSKVKQAPIGTGHVVLSVTVSR